MKIALVCSHGGHLTELMYLSEAFKEADTFLVSYDNPRTRAIDSRKLLLPNLGEKPHECFRQIPRMIRVLQKEKPDVIISNGAELAIPFFYLGKALGSRTVFIECFTRIDQPTITGKLVYPVSDLFLVLWPEMLNLYRHRAEYWGGLFDIRYPDIHSTSEGKDGILVVTGMHSKGFDRLVKKIDEIAGTLDEEVVVQIGHTAYEPKNCRFFRFLERDEDIRKLMSQSRIVVGQGAMTLVDSLMLETPVIAIPRLERYGEHINDHQMVFSRKLEELGLTRVIEDMEDLGNVISQKQPAYNKRICVNEMLVSRLKKWLRGGE